MKLNKDIKFITTINTLVSKFRYYSTYTEELDKALDSSDGAKIAKAFTTAFDLINKANNTQPEDIK